MGWFPFWLVKAVGKVNVQLSKTTNMLDTAESVTIAAGVAAATGNSSNLILDGAGGAADDLDSITGFSENDLVYIRCASALRPITMVKGAGLKMPGNFVLNNTYDIWEGLCIGSNTFIEVSRKSNA